jgi:hypothetical protein
LGFLLFFAVLALPFIIGVLSSQSTDVPGLPSGTQQLENTTNQITNAVSNWQVIEQNLKTSLLSNPTINSINSFFTSIGIVFRILFGQDYSLSLVLFITIILWVFFVISFNRIFKNFMPFSKGISFIISILLTIILAQIQILDGISNFIISRIFNLSWWIQIIIIFIIVVALIVILSLLKRFNIQSAKRREKENRFKLETGAKVGENISKAADEK